MNSLLPPSNPRNDEESAPTRYSFKTTPLWSDGLSDRYPSPPPGSMRVDCVVIGGGLSGLSAAYHLLAADPARRVVVLEADRLGSGASARSTGMLTPGVGQNLKGLARRFGRDQAAAMYRQTLKAVEYVGELTEREGIDCQLRMTGQLVVARGRSGQKRLDDQARALEDLGLAVERLDRGALEAHIRLDSPAGLRLPTAGLLHPGRLLSGLARSILDRGGCIYEGAKVLRLGPGQPATIEIAGGTTIIAEHVVLAAGGYTEKLGFQRGRIIPLDLRVLLTAPLSPAQLDRIGWTQREGVIDSRRIFNYFRLTEDRRILFGGGVPRYRRRGSNLNSIHGARRAVGHLVGELNATFPPGLELRVERTWSGVIGYVLDTVPVVDRLRQHPAVICVGGWCGHGIALSVSSGAWVQHLIDHGSPPQALPWFRDRPPLVPTELARFIGIPIGSWALSQLDRF